ncbi:MAG: hypothetical protein M3Q45_03150 [Chloroflexota bacterium]|nr:hypothetical protein [Chloroflexota bacterium]
MTQQTSGHTQPKSIINQIREGMTVYDNQNQNIGSVDEVHFGAASQAQREHGTGPATVNEPDLPGEHSFVGLLADVFDPSEVPDELADKLLRTGYIRIDSAGLFAADRYVMPDQIASVVGDEVHLQVTRDSLVKRS